MYSLIIKVLVPLGSTIHRISPSRKRAIELALANTLYTIGEVDEVLEVEIFHGNIRLVLSTEEEIEVDVVHFITEWAIRVSQQMGMTVVNKSKVEWELWEVESDDIG